MFDIIYHCHCHYLA